MSERESEKSSLIVFVSVVFVTWELWFDEWNSFHGNPNDNVWLSHSQIIIFLFRESQFFFGGDFIFFFLISLIEGHLMMNGIEWGILLNHDLIHKIGWFLQCSEFGELKSETYLMRTFGLSSSCLRFPKL